jgi:ligand-binding SRPBCC domain-containing protein
MIHRLEREQLLPLPVDEVFAFFARAHNLEAITPPWLHFEVLTPEPVRMGPRALIEYRLRLHGLPLRWLTRIEEWEPNRSFVDRQLRGPYRLWHHRHEFTAVDSGTLVRDRVHYRLPLGPLGELAHRLLVRGDLERIFDFRHDAVSRMLGDGAQASEPPARIARAGAVTS